MDASKDDNPLRLRDRGAAVSRAHEGVEPREGLSPRHHIHDADAHLHDQLLRDQDPEAQSLAYGEDGMGWDGMGVAAMAFET